MDILFLTLEEILEIHQDQIRRYGGTGGVRDIGLLQSAIAMPMAQFGGVFMHPDLYAMAAAYLFHIAQNHPFLDGNKRVAVVAALIFLSLNGIEVTADEEALEEMVLTVARGEMDKEGIAHFLADNARAT